MNSGIGGLNSDKGGPLPAVSSSYPSATATSKPMIITGSSSQRTDEASDAANHLTPLTPVTPGRPAATGSSSGGGGDGGVGRRPHSVPVDDSDGASSGGCSRPSPPNSTVSRIREHVDEFMGASMDEHKQ